MNSIIDTQFVNDTPQEKFKFPKFRFSVLRSLGSRALGFIRTYNISLTIAVCSALLAGLYIWTVLPVPYNLSYQFKLMTKTPTFVCKDGEYSFAVVPKGACSDHGGISGKFQGF